MHTYIQSQPIIRESAGFLLGYIGDALTAQLEGVKFPCDKDKLWESMTKALAEDKDPSVQITLATALNVLVERHPTIFASCSTILFSAIETAASYYPV